MISTVIIAAALAFSPVVEFTSDSVYKKDKVLEFSLTDKVTTFTDNATEEVVSETHEYTLNVKENYVLGYDVFDDPNTDYVDGIKIDGVFLPSSWTVDKFDPEAEHKITVKTVYSGDISGWLAMAKDGDFSALFANPITVLQLVYYVLAGLSLVLGGFGLVKSKKAKIKSANDIAAAVEAQSAKLGEAAAKGMNELEVNAMSLVTDIVTPLVQTLGKQNDTLIKATVLARNGDEASTLALLDLLKQSGADGIADISESVKARIVESKAKAEEAKRNAIAAMKEAVASIPAPTDVGGGYDGTSI